MHCQFEPPSSDIDSHIGIQKLHPSRPHVQTQSNRYIFKPHRDLDIYCSVPIFFFQFFTTHSSIARCTSSGVYSSNISLSHPQLSGSLYRTPRSRVSSFLDASSRSSNSTPHAFHKKEKSILSPPMLGGG